MRKNEGRTVGLFTKVSPAEKAVIDQKMALLGTMNLRAYLRKMAVDGYVVQLDLSSVAELVKLLRSVSSNVNQIARRCNETRNLYAQDVEDLRRGYTEVWQGITNLLKKFESL
ncbi:plasmid mobilization relaxosome protein MobC [Pseudoflavonifractor sp. 524-17]|uniref:plasmid mobilization protein n=1 Tax=Pseudoflavonifractor sp. 524-17 TaxID=2304577 RepID=UPI00137B122C|nr:plasmid mobilization relaxosome protein MobC [Pseudoflavonifractor sp. 524-17]